MNQLLLQAKVRELIEDSKREVYCYCGRCDKADMYGDDRSVIEEINEDKLERILFEYLQEQQREQRDGLSQLLAQAKQLTGVSS